MTDRDYIIRCRYMDGGTWKEESHDVPQTSMERAWRIASTHAKGLDSMYGGTHFWTVDLTNADGESYVQLFHGRLV